MCDDVVCGNRKRKNIVLVVQGKRPRSQMTGSEGIDHGDSRVTDGTYGRDAWLALAWWWQAHDA